MSNPVNIAMARCTQCGQVDATTRSICSNCLGMTLERCEVTGQGNLVSWTTIRRAPTRFREDAPYHVCVVDLDSGQRVTGRLQLLEGAEAGARVAAVDASGSAPIFQLNPG
jgi:uncharacterized OB-fold protein